MTTKFLASLFVLSLSFGLCTSTFAANSEKGGSTLSIRFEGRIIDSGCELSTNQKGDSVYLGTYPTRFFRNYRPQVETESVPFELVIRRCRLIKSDKNTKLGTEDFPVERVKLTFTDEGIPDARRARDGIMFASKEDESCARNVGVRVKYKNSNNKFANVFDDATSKDISISGMQYKLTSREGVPEYRLPFKANMVATGTGPVSHGSVNGRMTVTLTYE